MADDAPARVQPVAEALERLDGAGPARLDAALERVELALELREQRPHAGLDVLGADLAEAGQSGRVDQRVGDRGGFAHQKRRVYETSVPGSSGRATSSTKEWSTESRSSARRANTRPAATRGVSEPPGT